MYMCIVCKMYTCMSSLLFSSFGIQVFVIDKKLFTLGFIDEGFTRLSLRSCDGEKPSRVSGISLTAVDSNMHQHGNLRNNYDIIIHKYYVYTCTCTIEVL